MLVSVPQQRQGPRSPFGIDICIHTRHRLATTMFRCHPTRSSVMEKTFLLLVLVVVGVVLVGGQALPTLLITVEDSRGYRYPHVSRGGSPSLLSLCGWPGLQCRGGGGGEGGSFHKGGGAIELNPAFQGYNPSFKNEHEEWLQQQQQQQQEPYDTLFHQHSSVPIPRMTISNGARGRWRSG